MRVLPGLLLKSVPISSLVMSGLPPLVISSIGLNNKMSSDQHLHNKTLGQEFPNFKLLKNNVYTLFKGDYSSLGSLESILKGMAQKCAFSHGLQVILS